MWRSLGQGAGGSMGGGGSGGMIKTVQRAVRAGSGGHGLSHEPFYRSTNHNQTTNPSTYKPSSSSSDDNQNHNHNHSHNNINSNTLCFSSNDHLPPFSSVNSISPPTGDEYDNYVFCTVPSMDEVHHAVSSLQQVLDPPTSSHESQSGWEYDWIEPSTSMLHSRGSQTVYDAFHLLQTEPSVKKMVISLSSDKSVWEAVMNNEMVRELRDSVYQANKRITGRSDEVESSDGQIPVSNVLNWIFINTRVKVMEVIQNITEMVNKLFQPPRKDTNSSKEESVASESFEKKLRSSFMLSIMVLLIVVVSRSNRS